MAMPKNSNDFAPCPRKAGERGTHDASAPRPSDDAEYRGRVLIVNSTALRTSIYAAALTLQGFFTRSVGNAEAAAHALGNSRFDCVLADCHESAPNAFVRGLRATGENTPAVMLLKSYGGDPLMPSSTHNTTVSLPQGAPMASVVGAISDLVERTRQPFTPGSKTVPREQAWMRTPNEFTQ